ncbi:MAG TPA: hypothetical protein VMU45_07575 [Candidatus Eisenbacteria bacterium]|nr:hypothetical protein [Candidatus Eisenbacteria bacterium]
MGLLHITALAEDLGYLTDQQKNSGDLKYSAYLSVIDADGKPVTRLGKSDFGPVMFDGVETIRLDSEWEVKQAVGGKISVAEGFYGLRIDRPLKNQEVLPSARLFGLTVRRGADAGQTIFKVTYQHQ